MGTAVFFDKVERQTQVACRQFLGVDEKEREKIRVALLPWGPSEMKRLMALWDSRLWWVFGDSGHPLLSWCDWAAQGTLWVGGSLG